METGRQIKDLGSFNGFHKNVPTEFIKCTNLGHIPIKTNLGKCLNEYTCKICQIKYSVDSSG